jgi:hypothetical protein
MAESQLTLFPEDGQQKPAAKRCRKCGRTFPYTAEFFATRKATRFGLRARCLKCIRHETNWRGVDWRRALRLEVLTHYSGGSTPSCACCGVDIFEWLALDHLQGSSQEDCRKYGSPDHYFSRLKREGYPPHFQVACHNCNTCRSILGYCVHNPETKPEGLYRRKGGPKSVAITPVTEPAPFPVATCRVCKRVFPLTAKHFHKHASAATGFRGDCKECNHLAALESARARRRRFKEQVLAHYCQDNPRCECCGVTTFEFLTVDHLAGGGAEHRRREGFGDLCGWLVKNGMPGGYRILCFNCNLASGFYGSCPCRHHTPRITSGIEDK